MFLHCLPALRRLSVLLPGAVDQERDPAGEEAISSMARPTIRCPKTAQRGDSRPSMPRLPDTERRPYPSSPSRAVLIHLELMTPNSRHLGDSGWTADTLRATSATVACLKVTHSRHGTTDRRRVGEHSVTALIFGNYKPIVEHAKFVDMGRTVHNDIGIVPGRHEYYNRRQYWP